MRRVIPGINDPGGALGNRRSSQCNMLRGFAGMSQAAAQRRREPRFRWNSLLLVGVALWPRAAEDARALRCEIGLQCFPRNECDILALGIGADGIGRVVEGEAGALAWFGRWREGHGADLE